MLTYHQTQILKKGWQQLCRRIHSSALLFHENPLGLPRFNDQKGPQMPKVAGKLPIKQRIPNIKSIFLVASGKGGVGKSTVSVNLAAALLQLGRKVGILDADIFGPSIPKLLNMKGEPRISDSGKLLPLSNYGIETMSMGYLVPPENAVVWRGLMVMKGLQQLLFEVEWSNLDYLVIDMPPGTGDTQLTIGQLLKVDGAVIVTTPQDIALIDAVKGISMFNKVRIPILGLVQNMSYYLCPNCNHESHIFGTDGAYKEAKKNKVEVLGSVPLNEEICLQSDEGKPLVISQPDSKLAQIYKDIAVKIEQQLN